MNLLDVSTLIPPLASLSLLLVCAGGFLFFLAVCVGWARDLLEYALPRQWQSNPLRAKLDSYQKAFNRLYKDSDWHEWEAEPNEPVTHRPGALMDHEIHRMLLHETARHYGYESDPARLGHYKFQDGECITVDAPTPLAAIAYELELLLDLEAASHPLEKPLQTEASQASEGETA